MLSVHGTKVVDARTGNSTVGQYVELLWYTEHQDELLPFHSFKGTTLEPPRMFLTTLEVEMEVHLDKLKGG